MKQWVKASKEMFTKEEKMSLATFLKKIGMVPSSSEGIRMIDAGAVTVYLDPEDFENML